MVLFFFNDTATTEIYALSLHDALPISGRRLPTAEPVDKPALGVADSRLRVTAERSRDRKSTRLNSSHQIISYAVFCLKKKKQAREQTYRRAPVRSAEVQSVSESRARAT